MRQRVSIVEGKRPILLIAPYGANHHNTDLLVDLLARKLNGYAVINWGWKRSTTINYREDLADCGNVNQIHQNILYDEFLDPILRFKKRISRYYNTIHIIIITGHINGAAPGGVDSVLGYGKNTSFTCEEWRKNLLIYLAQKEGLNIYEAKSTSKLQATHRTHLNQLFREWYPDKHAQSIQLDFVDDLRREQADIDIVVEFMSNILSKYYILPKQKAKTLVPGEFKIRIFNQ
jgi:hypothetical protein